jgi:hypothetical protein
MANSSGNSNSGLAFIVGGLLVAVAVLAVILFNNGAIQAPSSGGSSTTNNFSRNLNLKVDPPKVEVPAIPAAPAPAPAAE